MSSEDHIKRAERIRFDVPLASSVDQEIKGQVENLSLSGCKLNSSSWIQLNGDEHQVQIMTPTGEVLTLKGQIVRAKMVPSDSGGIYELGIEFERQTPAYRSYQNWLQSVPASLGDSVSVGP